MFVFLFYFDYVELLFSRAIFIMKISITQFLSFAYLFVFTFHCICFQGTHGQVMSEVCNHITWLHAASLVFCVLTTAVGIDLLSQKRCIFLFCETACVARTKRFRGIRNKVSFATECLDFKIFLNKYVMDGCDLDVS